jgi:hypothetical protein
MIIFGIIISLFGSWIIVQTDKWLGFFGRIEFFERHLGAEGGSRMGYKLIGIIFIFLGVLIITGLFQGFANWVLSPLIKTAKF